MMRLYCLVIITIVGAEVALSQTEDTFRIVAVVNQATPEVETNLQHGVDYLNSPWNPSTLARTVVMETIMTQDNDSFGAMDQMCDKIQDGVSVIVDFSSRHVTAAMRSLAEAMGIGHVSGLDQSYEAEVGKYNLSVNVRAPAGQMLWSIRDIVSQENITTAAIVYDMSFDLSDKPKRLLRNVPTQHMYLSMALDTDAIEAQLEKIKNANLLHIFLAATAENAAAYLARANYEGMMNFKYNWYVITKDSSVQCSGCIRDSQFVALTGRPVPAQADEYVDFVTGLMTTAGMNYSADDLEIGAAFQFDVMVMVGSALGTMLGSGNWQDITYVDCFALAETDPIAQAQSRQLVETVASVDRLGIFGEFEWTDEASSQEITLQIRRQEYLGGNVENSQLIGNWSMSAGLNAFGGSITNSDVTKVYRIMTVEEPPFTFKSTVRPPVAEVENVYFNNATGYYYYGYCIDLIFKIQESLDFVLELKEPADGAYGTMQADGSWNGMIRELMDDHADIIVSPLSVMAERENVIDFTVPYYDLVGITILMRKPSFDYELFKFMNVLENSVWGCIFSAFLLVAILLAVFDRLSPFSYQNNRHAWPTTGDPPRIFTLKEGLWFCMTSLTPQGGGEAPRALSGRLVAATWWMFGFIMIATYTANLAAFLTVSRLDQPIESLDDLAEQFQTKYAPQQSTATETYFRRMAEIEEKFYEIWKEMSLNDSLDEISRAQLAVWDYPVSDKFTNMWHTMEETGLPENFTDAIARIKAGTEDEEFAFIGDATQNKYATLTDCELWEVGEEFSRKPYALAVQEGSTLKNTLSSIILQLLNQRYLEELKTKWWDYGRVTCDEIEDESDGISIANIGGVFILIFIGIGLGLITLLFEFYWYRWRPQAAAKGSVSNGSAKHNKSGKDGVDNTAFNGIAG